MKNILALIIFCTINFLVYSQKKDVEIISVQNKNGFVLSAVNNSNTQQEVTLKVEAINLKGYKSPIKMQVPAKTKTEMLTLLFIKNKKGRFNYNFSYKPSLSNKEKHTQEKELNTKIANDFGDVKKGIVVFSKDGCSRCHFTTRYMLDNNIDFKLINVSNNDQNQNMMWQLIKKENPIVKSLTMPVILINGEVSFNINDLKGFVSNLKE